MMSSRGASTRKPSSMGQRRGGGRSGGNFTLGGNTSKKLSFSQSPSGRPQRSGPLRHSSPQNHPFSNRRPSLSSDCSTGSSTGSSNKIYIGKWDKHLSSPTYEVDKSSLWSERSLSNCSINTNILSSESESGTSSSACNKKNDRPSARPSNPLRYKTELCRSFEEGGICRFGNSCTFAHGLGELRAVPRHPRYKTDPCRTYHTLGYCQYGARCHFVHDPEEAAGVSPMRGHKLHLRQDRLNATIMAMAKKANLNSEATTNSVFLDNLLNLHAVRTMKEQEQKAAELLADSIREESKLDLGINLNSDPSVILDYVTRINLSESLTSTGIFDASLDYLKDSFNQTTDSKIEKGFDTSTFLTSTMSISPPSDAWWGAWSGVLTPPLSPDSDCKAAQNREEFQKSCKDAQNSSDPQTLLNIQNSLEVTKPPFSVQEMNEGDSNPKTTQAQFEALRKIFEGPSQSFPTMHEMREMLNSKGNPIIANPMDMSRKLELPNIMELCHTS